MTAPAPPGWLGLVAVRTKLELLIFVRDRQQLIFSFLYPVLMLVIFGSVFSGQDVAGGVSFVRYFVPGIAATGVMLASFQNLAISIAVERHMGELARLQNVALPAISFFLGKAGQVLALVVVQMVAVLVIGRLAFDVPLPASAVQWTTLVWATVLGALAGSVLGIAASSVPANGRSAGAVIAPIALVLQFFSGVFFVYTELPGWMQHVAAVFPLKWLTQAMRSAFLPDQAHTAEVAGSWERGPCALVLLAWTIGGIVIAWRTFSWRPRE